MTTSEASPGTPRLMSEQQFEEMCRRHDLTYVYSDDGGVWRAGEKSLDAIIVAAADLPREVAVRIWNEIVDTKVMPEYREQFYWKV